MPELRIEHLKPKGPGRKILFEREASVSVGKPPPRVATTKNVYGQKKQTQPFLRGHTKREGGTSRPLATAKGGVFVLDHLITGVGGYCLGVRREGKRNRGDAQLVPQKRGTGGSRREDGQRYLGEYVRLGSIPAPEGKQMSVGRGEQEREGEGHQLGSLVQG